MNPGQEKFFKFIMERVRDGKQEDAKALLNGSFCKQTNGNFNAEYLNGFIPKMIGLLKPENINRK